MIFKTSAPYSPRILVMVGPAIIRHNSRTLIPERMRLSPELGSGVGGVMFSRLVTSQGGRDRFTFPCKPSKSHVILQVMQFSHTCGVSKKSSYLKALIPA